MDPDSLDPEFPADRYETLPEHRIHGLSELGHGSKWLAPSGREEGYLTVGELKKALEGYADNLHVYVRDPRSGRSQMLLRVLPPEEQTAEGRSLSLEQANEIRTTYERALRGEPGGKVQIDLSLDFGVSHQVIYAIIAAKTYKDGVLTLEFEAPSHGPKHPK